MVIAWASRTVFGLFDAVFRPSRFVRAPSATGRASIRGALGRIRSLSLVFLVNVLLYATPLTLSGLGVAVETDAPGWFAPIASRTLGNPDAAWWLLAGIAQNSAFLAALSGIVLVTYHLALVVTRSSDGFLLTLHTVVYSVSAYLAAIFTLLVFLTRAEALATARDLVVNLQIRFITVIYDAFDVPQSNRVFTLDAPVSIAQLSSNETLVLAGLAALVLYFAYSMYLGARLNHGAGVVSAVLSLIAVGLSPVLYVSALILFSIGGQTV
jgi:hypothetical protein